MSAIYIYDRRTQLTEPVAIVYDKKNVELVIMALFGCLPDYVFESLIRLHPYDADPYKSMGSKKLQQTKR